MHFETTSRKKLFRNQFQCLTLKWGPKIDIAHYQSLQKWGPFSENFPFLGANTFHRERKKNVAHFHFHPKNHFRQREKNPNLAKVDAFFTLYRDLSPLKTFWVTKYQKSKVNNINFHAKFAPILRRKYWYEPRVSLVSLIFL